MSIRDDIANDNIDKLHEIAANAGRPRLGACSQIGGMIDRVTAGYISPPEDAMEIKKSGIELIAEERKRQTDEEGWTPEHDDQHEDGELALVAALYAAPEPLYLLSIDDEREESRPSHRGVTIEVDDPWPVGWNESWDKRDKHDRLRQLVIAGALIAAEIDRLQRHGLGVKSPADLL